MVAVMLQWQSGAVVTETTWPAKPNIFAIGFFTENALPTHVRDHRLFGWNSQMWGINKHLI